MSFEVWLAFTAASCALLLVPGPTVLLVLSYALSKGRNVAVACAAGVAFGDFIALTASLLGLGALVLASATAFTVLKWVGAVYLVWLGIKMIRSARQDVLKPPGQGQSKSVFGHAATVTALNPKSIAFFIAFVPQFIDAQSALLPQFALLVATFVTLAGVNALAYALLADRLRQTISRPRILTWIARTGGATLIGMGLATAALRRAT